MLSMSALGTQQTLARILGGPLLGVKRTRRTKQEISLEAGATMGNSGVTTVGVVERVTLQRDEAREDQTDYRSNVFKVQSEAEGGQISRK